jgi:hypothetical protein
MSIYDVNFNTTTVELLPTHKRVEKIQYVLYSLQKPLNDNATFFRWIREGTEAAEYNAGTTYNFADVAAYQRRTYFRNEVTEGYSAGIAPNDVTYWTKVLDNNIGLDTRIRFTTQKILLEYALNVIFGTTFNQPPVLSEIYIENNTQDIDDFFVGELDTDTATVSETDQSADYFVNELDGDLSGDDFIIYVPVAVWTALAGTSQERDNIVLTVANNLKLFGYTAEVQTY